MKIAKISIMILIVSIISFNLFSQQVKYVDIPSTEKQIEALNQSSAEYDQKTQTLDSEIASLETQLAADQEQLRKIEILVNKMIYKGALMKEYADNVVDESAKQKAIDAFTSYRESLEQLLNKQDVLKVAIRRAEVTIREKKVQKSANNHMVILNNLKIRELQKAIEVSQSQAGNIDSHIEILNNYLSEAQTLLN